MGSLDGKVAVITGGGRGIGAAVVRLLAAEGAALVINDLGSGTDGSGYASGPASEIAAEVVANGGRAVYDDADVADVATGQRLINTAVEQFGKLDIVVNVAGILRDRMIFNLSEADWDAVIRVHLKGHYSTVRPAAAYFREQRNPDGHYRIINFTSGSGLHGSPGQPNYAAAKMGIVGLTYSLAQGLARYGVTANAIAPAAMTRLVATVPDEKMLAAPELSQMAPEDIAPLVGYLAGERSDWLSGRVLFAQGQRVGLYNNPEEIAAVESASKWTSEELAHRLEQEFRPLADGLPTNMFTSQAG
ncbi:SDR family NAD(P)-dependent oxidoreductase [Nocardia sp. bgisy134]|uniref:SDR family NAD(P)-dependent oxidoreductase n=1 Tax=Nocardia sp. bgisy134 TaxID=3413789 RepID=UPI003D75427A